MQRIGPLLPIGSGDTARRHGARRRSQRYPLNAQVSVIEPIDTKGITLNASSGGLRVMLVDELSAGESCLLEVRFTEERRSLEKVRVVWAQEHPDGWIVGLEFLDVTWSIPTNGPQAA